MFTLTRVCIAIFTLAVVFGPLYTSAEYSVVTNLISELGAQHTQNNFIMIIAVVILGGGIIIDGIRTFRVSLLPFIIFGMAMAVVGIFPHKPIDTSLGACPRIDILFKIEAFTKNKHSHIVDIASIVFCK